MLKNAAIVGLALLVPLADLSIAGHRGVDAFRSRAPRPDAHIPAKIPSVQVEPICVGELVEVVLATGEVQCSSRAVIAAPVAGEITELHVKQGDRVTKGQVVARVGTKDHATITSPIDGVVLRRLAEVGQIVVPSTPARAGTTLMEIGDPSQLVLAAVVEARSAAIVQPKQHAIVQTATAPNKTFDGTVESIDDPHVDRGPDPNPYVKCRIRITGKVEPALRDAIGADAEIQIQTHRGLKIASRAILTLPLESLPQAFRKNPQLPPSGKAATIVYRLVNGRAVLTPVKVGAIGRTESLITAGLAEGDRIITGPLQELETLKDGQSVTDGKPERPATQSKPKA